MKGQLSRAPSLSGSNRSHLWLLLFILLGAPLAPVHVSYGEPLPHLGIKDSAIDLKLKKKHVTGDHLQRISSLVDHSSTNAVYKGFVERPLFHPLSPCHRCSPPAVLCNEPQLTMLEPSLLQGIGRRVSFLELPLFLVPTGRICGCYSVCWVRRLLLFMSATASLCRI